MKSWVHFLFSHARLGLHFVFSRGVGLAGDLLCVLARGWGLWGSDFMLDSLCKMGVSSLLVVCCGRICDFGGDFKVGLASGFIQECCLSFMGLVGLWGFGLA